MVDLLCSGSHAYRSWRGRTSLELVSIYGIRTNSIQVASRGLHFRGLLTLLLYQILQLP